MKLGGICLNWKVVAGLAVVGLGLWVVAPNRVGAALPLLLVAACPLSMLVMMRGMGGGMRTSPPEKTEPHRSAGLPLTRDEQLRELKERAAGLRTRHDLIAGEIARLEASGSSAVLEADIPARVSVRRIP